MRAITRGWVVQVTPVHERSSPTAAWFCFAFYTVTRRRRRGTSFTDSFGPARTWPWGSSAAGQAAGETRRWGGKLKSSEDSGVSRALGTWWGGRPAFGGQESGTICRLHQHS